MNKIEIDKRHQDDLLDWLADHCPDPVYATCLLAVVLKGCLKVTPIEEIRLEIPPSGYLPQ